MKVLNILIFHSNLIVLNIILLPQRIN